MYVKYVCACVCMCVHVRVRMCRPLDQSIYIHILAGPVVSRLKAVSCKSGSPESTLEFFSGHPYQSSLLVDEQTVSGFQKFILVQSQIIRWFGIYLKMQVHKKSRRLIVGCMYIQPGRVFHIQTNSISSHIWL